MKEDAKCGINYKKSRMLPSGECLENLEIEVIGNNLKEVRKHFDEVKANG